MWDLQKRQRFQELRARGEARDAAEQTELAALVKELETDESTYLADATLRLRQKRELAEKQNHSLEALAMRRRALVERLDKTLVEAQSERRAIDSELALVLAGANKEE